MTTSADIQALAVQVRLVILDVDGVLTDGGLYYTAAGEELKRFNVQDGLGIRLLVEHDIKVAVITARRSAALERRMDDLGIREHFYPGQPQKMQAYERLLSALHLADKDVAYVGDDLLDLPVMRRVLLPISVANGHGLVRAEARYVTGAQGGHGAVREVADTLLASRGDLKTLCDDFLARHMQKGVLETA